MVTCIICCLPPMAAKTCQQPCTEVLLVCFSLASRIAVSFGNSFIHLPSFLPPSLSFTHLINLSFSHLPYRRPINRHKETADMSEGRRQHEEHSISRKVDIEGPQRINREAYHQSNQHSLFSSCLLCLLLLLPFNEFPPPSQFGTSHAEVIGEVFLSFFFCYHFALKILSLFIVIRSLTVIAERSYAASAVRSDINTPDYSLFPQVLFQHPLHLSLPTAPPHLISSYHPPHRKTH